MDFAIKKSLDGLAKRMTISLQKKIISQNIDKLSFKYLLKR